VASVRRRETAAGVRYDVRYRDPDGNQLTATFTQKAKADAFKVTIEADKVRGVYVDPRAGRVTFRDFATEWLESRTFDESTRQAVELRLRVHAFPVLGDKQLGKVKPSTIQAWLRGLSNLAPTYRRVVFVNVSSVFAAAVDDELIVKNPCRASSVAVPRVERRLVVPWSAERVRAVTAQLPDRYRIVAMLAAGLGLRQGEVFGLSPDDVDFLRGKVEVRRQVKLFADGSMVFALPKGTKTRTVPLPSSVRDALAAHLAASPAVPVTLAHETHTLAVTTRERHAVSRNYFNRHVWSPALERAGVPRSRENGMHALRHFYASVLLDAGDSIKAVSEYLGHTDAGFTLRTYTHLIPASDERTRRAVDAVYATSMPQANENR
jgi:integrase